MSKILSNRQLTEDFFLMEVAHPNTARMGQFYMLRAWQDYPVLSRPLSVHDATAETLTFLYKVFGKGTAIFSRLRPGEEITLQGPLGNTFPASADCRRIALVGGGVGIAPFYLAARTLRREAPACRIELYLGFSGQPLLVEEYREVADSVTVNVGGFVTDQIEPEQYDRILTCGPEPMMKALYDKCSRSGVADRLYVSLENRMACGIGACLVCTCKNRSGNKKACKDGPIFPGMEVYA